MSAQNNNKDARIWVTITFGEYLRMLRDIKIPPDKTKESHEAAAENMGIDADLLHSWEYDKAKPNFKNIICLAEYYGIDPQRMMDYCYPCGTEKTTLEDRHKYTQHGIWGYFFDVCEIFSYFDFSGIAICNQSIFPFNTIKTKRDTENKREVIRLSDSKNNRLVLTNNNVNSAVSVAHNPHVAYSYKLKVSDMIFPTKEEYNNNFRQEIQLTFFSKGKI